MTASASVLNTRHFDILLRTLRERHGEVRPAKLGLIEQFVWSFLVWEADPADAERALHRLQKAVVDNNELRVCLPDEIVSIIGPRYPRAQERALRLRAGLQDIYFREHMVSLDHLTEAPKRIAKQYLDTLDGVPPFVASRVLLLGLGGHAVPIDDRLLNNLVEAGTLESDTTPERASAALERHIKAEDAVDAHMLLMAWCVAGAPTPKPLLKSRAAKPPKGKTKKD